MALLFRCYFLEQKKRTEFLKKEQIACGAVFFITGNLTLVVDWLDD